MRILLVSVKEMTRTNKLILPLYIPTKQLQSLLRHFASVRLNFSVQFSSNCLVLS